MELVLRKRTHWIYTLLKRKAMSSRNFISLALAATLLPCSNLFAQTGAPDPVIARPAQAGVNAAWRWPLTGPGSGDTVTCQSPRFLGE